jgi:hypothetical protein
VTTLPPNIRHPNKPPGTPTSDELVELPTTRFQEVVAKRLPFTRSNQWIWRSLLHPTCIGRTEATLKQMRKSLEAGIRRKEIPDDNPAHQQRELINARQEQLDHLLRAKKTVAHLAEQRNAYRDAIRKHQAACKANDIIPEQHDLDLWNVLRRTTGADA